LPLSSPFLMLVTSPTSMSLSFPTQIATCVVEGILEAHVP
jgi:hypothetical protein